MKTAGQRASPRFLVLVILICLMGGAAHGENIDPDGDGSKYAWSENLGWINAQPNGPGGPGVQVSDSDLTGWAWSENAGWISLSCTNLSCSGGSYGVTNDGCGTLAGYAWSENVGWINFAPSCGGEATCGIKVDPTTGVFSGRGWSENAGWLTFSSNSPHPYQVATSWRGLHPGGAPHLTEARSGVSDARLSWGATLTTAGYDVVYGDLNLLRASGGDFQVATLGQLVCNTSLLSLIQSGNPSPGNGFWFLARSRNCGGVSGYGGSNRDSGIAASGLDCPLP